MPSKVTNLQDSGPGSLRDAIANTQAGGTVNFAPELTGTIALTTNTLSISKDIAINGSGANAITVSGNNNFPVFTVSSLNFSALPKVSLSGLTIANGRAFDTALGIGNGGGINNSGILNLSDCVIRNNTAGVGGGLASIGDDCAVTIQNCTFSENITLATLGGRGGGIVFAGGFNQAATGMNKITNCTIVNNNAAGDGGGIHCSGSQVAIRSCTIEGNSGGFGGGIYASGGTVTLEHTIVASNTAGTGPDAYIFSWADFTDLGHNLIGDTTGFSASFSNSDLLNRMPLLGPLADNGGPTQTMALLSGSPAINAGDPSYQQPPSTDQRGTGYFRIRGTAVDIGAFESGNKIYRKPTITDFRPASGKVGSRVVITGTEFIDVSAVAFNGVATSTFTVDSSTQITAKVPKGATTGRITVTTPGGTAISRTDFTVLAPGLPTIRSFTPVSGPIGTQVTVIGTDFVDVSAVAFNGVPASNFAVDSDMLITVTVPVEASTGPITVTTPMGEAESSEDFTVTTPPAKRFFAAGVESGEPRVLVWHAVDAATKSLVHNFLAYDAGFTGGVRVALGDVNGDGVPDIITAPGPGGGPDIHVFDGSTGQIFRQFFAYDKRFTAGVFVASGDLDADGFADIVCGPDAGGGPNVIAFSGRDGTVLDNFFAYDPRFTGGVRVALGDVNGDGNADIICGAGTGGGPNVNVFSGRDGSLLTSYFAFDARFSAGIYVAAGDIDADGYGDIVTGAGAGGGPNVTAYSYSLNRIIVNFFAYDPRFTGGVRVAAVERTGDGLAEIMTAPGRGGGADIATFDLFGRMIDHFFCYNPPYAGGLFLGGTLSGTLNVITRITDRLQARIPGLKPQIEVFLERIGSDGGRPPIQTGLQTWVVIHGRKDSSTSFKSLARAIDRYGTADQVLVLDWSPGAKDNSTLDELRGSAWIEQVADWTRRTLGGLGITPDMLFLVGHSWGSFVAYELAKQMGKTKGLVALDPAKSAPKYEAFPNVDFGAASEMSWVLRGGDGLYGSDAKSEKAHESYTLDFKSFLDLAPPRVSEAHRAPVEVFETLVRANTERDEPRERAALFSLSRLEGAGRGPWRENQYNSVGGWLGSRVFEAVIAVRNVNSNKLWGDSWNEIEELRYVNDLSGDEVKI